MTDDELRAMVRDAIVRSADARQVSGTFQAPAEGFVDRRAAFALLPLPRGGDTDGACLIEPSVRCNHCGYCQSYGH